MDWDAVAEEFGVIPRIGRRPWFHLLRHAGASSLVCGWWGARWRLEDVQRILGHADIKTTQRYAKVTAGPVQEVAAAAHVAFVNAHAAPEGSSRGCHASARQRPQLPKILGARPAGFEPATYGSGGRLNQPEQGVFSSRDTLVTSLAGTVRGVAEGRLRVSPTVLAELTAELDRLLREPLTFAGGGGRT